VVIAFDLVIKKEKSKWQNQPYLPGLITENDATILAKEFRTDMIGGGVWQLTPDSFFGKELPRWQAINQRKWNGKRDSWMDTGIR